MFKLSSFVPIFLVGMAAVAACQSAWSSIAVASQTQRLSIRPHAIKVYFPKNPPRQPRLDYVEPVWRQTQTSSVAQFAISQVIAGPTRQERQQGFTAPITLRGPSTCGSDFRFSLVASTAKLQFCRQVVSDGIGDDARALGSLTTTLKQFPTIQSVVILDRNGNCLGDMSGENRCLRR